MLDTNTSQAYLDTNINTDISTLECNLPCKVACSYECTKFERYLHTDFTCPKGLSINHINILSIIKENRLPLSFKHISEILLLHFETELSQGAVRGVIERLKRNKLVTSKLSRLVNRRGNLYTFTYLVCEHIPQIDTYLYTHFQKLSNTKTDTNNSTLAEHSIKDRLDRNISYLSNGHVRKMEFRECNSGIVTHKVDISTITYKQKLLSLSDEDISFFWPHLQKSGFGKIQIEQIVSRLEQQSLKLDNVIQGLTHAEWDLSHAQMKDKHAEQVKSPMNWVFQILARQGYYPRPHNYVSGEEQAEMDIKLESERLAKLQKENASNAFNTWLLSLSEEQKKEIINTQRKNANTHFTFPDSYWLKLHFNTMKEASL